MLWGLKTKEKSKTKTLGDEKWRPPPPYPKESTYGTWTHHAKTERDINIFKKFFITAATLSVNLRPRTVRLGQTRRSTRDRVEGPGRSGVSPVALPPPQLSPASFTTTHARSPFSFVEFTPIVRSLIYIPLGSSRSARIKKYEEKNNKRNKELKKSNKRPPPP